jgi:FkbM family methyltransferase
LIRANHERSGVCQELDAFSTLQQKIQLENLGREARRIADAIPKIVHHVYKTDISNGPWPNELWKTSFLAWKKFFPEPEYKHIFWSDDEVAAFIQEECSDFSQEFSAEKREIVKSDFSRYCLMWKLGGIYADLDYMPMRNFYEDLSPGMVNLVESPYRSETFQNSLMASPADNEYWEKLMRLATYTMKASNILLAAGPQLLDVLPLTHNASMVHTLPCNEFQRATHLNEERAARSKGCRSLKPEDVADKSLKGIHWGTVSYAPSGQTANSISAEPWIHQLHKTFSAHILEEGAARVATPIALNSERLEDCQLPSYAKWCTVKPKTGPSFEMAVYSSDDIVSTHVCDSGHWETEDPAHFGDKPGNALDIGGNIGYYSFFLANAGWRVHTFEPLPTNLNLINATLCRNPNLAKNITIHSVGLGAQDEDCVFMSGIDNVGDGTVKCGAEARNLLSGSTKVQDGYQLRGSFPMKKLDDILTLPNVPKMFDFVKLDVEGFECQVMKGAATLLTHIRPKLIQSEVWPKMSGCTSASYLNMYKEANYKVSKATGCSLEDSTLTGQIEDFYMCRRASLLLQLH